MLYVFGECTLDTQRYELCRAGRISRLRRKAFQVLVYLLAHPDRVVVKQELCEQVWPQQFISDAALESTIKAVRQAIGDSGRGQRLIQTVYGQGYRLIVPVEARPEPSPEDEGMAPPIEPLVAPLLPDAAGEDHPLAPAVLTDPLDEPPTQGAIPVSLPRVSDAERRQLTVMFCELVADLPLARHLDPDDLYAVLRPYQETCARIVQQFDGQIAQYRGEELVVYFGYPQAHDDDAQRAVRAGLKIVEALGEFHPRLAHEPGLRWAVRVGVHTGLVVVGPLGDGGPHDRWALGDTPTLAAQMQGLAAPDTVVISAATQRLIHGYFICHPLGAQSGQGMATPLQVYRVVRESETQHRLDVVSASSLTPFVGREHEVGLLVECWEQAKEGRGRIAVIQGEAGIGKSRLVRVLQEHLAAGPHTPIVWRGSPADQQSALHPVLTQLQRLVRARPEDTPAVILQRLEAVLASYGLALPEVVPLFATLLALPLSERYPPLLLTPQRQRQQTLEAVLAWLLAEATRQPVLFIVEDLHWIDPSTLEFLSLLIDQVPTARLLLVLTCRPEFHPSWRFRAHLTPITLGRLAPSQAALLVQRVAGKTLPPAVQQHLVAYTDGVPLFIEEVTKLVLESGVLQAHAGNDALPGPLPALAIPATLHATLMARLDRLASSKAVAQLGAVIGRTFPYDMLQAVSPWEETALQHGLRQLIEAELVYQRGVPPQATYTFKHALIQETAYQSLLTSTRQQYHRQIAQVVATRFPATVTAQPELLAHHYTEAGCHTQAIPYWQRAGQQAIERANYVEAASLLAKGLELVEALPDTPARARQELPLQNTLGKVLMLTKGYGTPEAEHALLRARALWHRGEDVAELFSVQQGLHTVAQARAELQRAWTLATDLLCIAQRQQDPVLSSRAYSVAGEDFLWLGELRAARTHLEQGLACYSPQQHAALDFRYVGAATGVACGATLAWTLWLLGYPEQALTRVHTARALAQQLSHPASLVYALDYAVGLHQLRREVRAVQERAEELSTLARAQEFPLWIAGSTAVQGWALAMQEHSTTRIGQIWEGLAAWRATGLELTRPWLLALIAEVYGQAGQAETGLAVLAEALALVDKTSERWYEAELYRLKGELLLAQAGIRDRGEEAEACFLQALAIARRQQAKSWELRTAMSLSRLGQRQGKRREARKLLAPIYGWFTEGFDTADLQEAKALLTE